jgi:hypothetical protein
MQGGRQLGVGAPLLMPRPVRLRSGLRFRGWSVNERPNLKFQWPRLRPASFAIRGRSFLVAMLISECFSGGFEFHALQADRACAGSREEPRRLEAPPGF